MSANQFSYEGLGTPRHGMLGAHRERSAPGGPGNLQLQGAVPRSGDAAVKQGKEFERGESVTMTAEARLRALLQERIMILDGAVGTMFQRERLSEEEWRGERFREHPKPVRGDSDLLSLSRPELVEKVHHAYLEAGADWVTTNTFTATPVSQADYDL